MEKSLDRQLAEMALDSAVSVFGEVVAYNSESIVFQSASGERKRMTYDQMHEVLNDVLNTLRNQ